jgi:hypothetical protein
MVGFQAPCARGRMVLYLREGERHLGNKRAHCQIGHVGYRIDAYSPSLLARVMAILGIGIRPIAATRAFCHFIPLRMELLLHPGPIGREQIMHVREQGTGQPRFASCSRWMSPRGDSTAHHTQKDESSRCENLAPSKRRVDGPSIPNGAACRVVDRLRTRAADDFLGAALWKCAASSITTFRAHARRR